MIHIFITLKNFAKILFEKEKLKMIIKIANDNNYLTNETFDNEKIYKHLRNLPTRLYFSQF